MHHASTSDQQAPRRGGILSILISLAHAALVVAAVGFLIYGAAGLRKAAPRPQPTTMPAAMVSVDWQSADSSVYCLACHKQMAPSIGGLDIEQGHPHMVQLSPEQQQAAAAMGTVVAPDGMMICRTCHKLGAEGPHPYMLAAELSGSELCLSCHAGPATILKGKHDLRTSSPDSRNRLGQTAAEGGPCSPCHLSHKYPRDFASTELDPDGRCVTCHSEYGPAAKLGGVHMEHPKSRCLECHDPHTDEHGSYLKAEATQLCIGCHADKAGGQDAGMHPLGRMDGELPAVLVQAGARLAGKGELACSTCHLTHKAGFDDLLVMNPNTNALCLACHEKDLATHAGGVASAHANEPVMTQAQQRVVRQRGGQVGEGGKMLCTSCHEAHAAADGHALLRFDLKSEESCRACHPEQGAVIGSRHDLRISAPEEKNGQGRAARETGACGACHTAHGPARSPSPTAGNPDGQCATCHSTGSMAGQKAGGAAGHPKADCRACHDPHAGKAAAFLEKPAAELCTGCHKETARIAGGPHDMKKGDAPDACSACHVPHGLAGNALFKAANGQAAAGHDEKCLSCHANVGWGAAGGHGIIHPREISPDQKKVPVALVPKDQAGAMRMGCRTCHDPHAGKEPQHLARVEPGQPSAALCTHCHGDKEQIRLTGHAPEKMAARGFAAESCKPCHAMHAEPREAWGQMLSPRFLEIGAKPVRAPAGQEGRLPCLACHQEGGVAPVREVTEHPAVSMVNNIAPEAAGYMPLFGKDGQVEVNGQITCRTCHLSHGRPDLLKPREAQQTQSPEEQRAVRMQLRPFEAPNICTECHGPSGRSKFLFFHNPQMRAAQ